MILMKYHTLFFSKIRKMSKKLSSAAMVIGALRVKEGFYLCAGNTGSKFVVANSLFKWKKLEPNKFDFSQKCVSRSYSLSKYGTFLKSEGIIKAIFKNPKADSK